MFSDHFLWGAASAANQYEGGFGEGGKGVANTDVMTAGSRTVPRYVTYTVHGENKKAELFGMMHLEEDAVVGIIPGENYPNHVSTDFYHHYKEDIQLMNELGLKAFRMSISWARIYPNGDDEAANEEGLLFYDGVIDALLEAGIEPIITINHYETPLALTNRWNAWADKRMISCFEKYCKTIFERYKNKVTYWITFNEINHINIIPFLAAGIVNATPQTIAEASLNEFVAAARVVRMGRAINPDFKFGCMIGHTQSYPYSCNPADVLKNRQFLSRMYFYGDVQVRGYYPSYQLKQYERDGIELQITEQEKTDLAQGTVDFITFSYYSSGTQSTDVSKKNSGKANMVDKGPKNPYLHESEWGWAMDPTGLRIALNDLYDRYQKPLMIVENGLGSQDTLTEEHTVHDAYRIEYLENHIREIEKAIEIDGVDVFGFTPWNFADCISASTGEYLKRYGFVYVDEKDHFKRYRKDSFYWYQNLLKEKSNG